MKKLLLFVMFLISLNSLSEEFKYDNGDRLIVDIVNGKKEGPYKYYVNNGEIEEGTFVNEKKEGPYKYYANNQDIKEGTYVNGKEEGPYKYYANNGDIEEGTFVNGKKKVLINIILKKMVVLKKELI